MTDKHLKPLLLFMLLLCSSAAFAYEQVTYYHNDALGSPIAASDSEGKILWRESYQPYGERQQHEPRANANRRWFTSHVEDADTGLLYMQARYYDPKIGRFMSMDPVGFVEENPMSFNRYAYANNNPYKYVDPDGRAIKLVKAAFNVVRKASKNGLDFKKAGKDEIADFVDNVSTLADGQFTADDVIAAIDIVTGFGGEVEKLGSNLNRFIKGTPSNAKNKIVARKLPNGGIAVQATSPAANIPGSKAVYEKQINSSGKTIQVTKTTYAPDGKIVHVKDKITDMEFK